jgi:hypothetical protein
MIIAIRKDEPMDTLKQIPSQELPSQVQQFVDQIENDLTTSYHLYASRTSRTGNHRKQLEIRVGLPWYRVRVRRYGSGDAAWTTVYAGGDIAVAAELYLTA